MNEPQRDAARTRFLLTNLAIIVIFILTLLVALAAYPDLLAPPPTRTPTHTPRRSATATATLSPTITFTPTITRTPRPSFTPTITLTPTRTATPTPSPIPLGPPTLTPARPVLGYENYRLFPWSESQAAYLIDLIQHYPNNLPRQSRGDRDANYYSAYFYATIAQSEALLRYPDSMNAEKWRWDLAYNLAQIGDKEAGRRYADIIITALNQGEVENDNLSEWFRLKEPRLELKTVPLKGIPGALKAWIVEIGGPGSAILILRETLGAYQSEVLVDYFDFINKPEYDIFAADLNKDDIEEAVIYLKSMPFDLNAWLPDVYDLSSDTPTLWPYHPDNPVLVHNTEGESQWDSSQAADGTHVLRYKATLFPACPLNVIHSYRYDGSWLITEHSTYSLKPNIGTLAYCQFVVDHAAINWGPQAAIDVMQQLAPLWPPQSDSGGNPYLPETMDEWRFRLAIYDALDNQLDKATQLMREIIEKPAALNSKWIQKARSFLEKYQTTGLYSACVEAEFCDPRTALKKFIVTITSAEYPQALEKFHKAGVALRSTGYFDFDGDSSREIWFTVRHQDGEKLELWILIPGPDRISPFYITSLETNVPTLKYYQEEPSPPIVLVNNASPFEVQRLPDSLVPYITIPKLPKTYPDRFNNKLLAARQALFSGEEPAKVQTMLLDIESDPGLLCKGFWTCDEYYYLRGLASELSGDHAEAIVSYVTLWWNYSRSPFTIMARLKLKGASISVTSTPTPTAAILTTTLTPTATRTAALTPGISLTPTPTSPISPTATRTPTLTVTAPYPGPVETQQPTYTSPPYP